MNKYLIATPEGKIATFYTERMLKNDQPVQVDMGEETKTCVVIQGGFPEYKEEPLFVEKEGQIRSLAIIDDEFPEPFMKK